MIVFAKIADLDTMFSKLYIYVIRFIPPILEMYKNYVEMIF